MEHGNDLYLVMKYNTNQQVPTQYLVGIYSSMKDANIKQQKECGPNSYPGLGQNALYSKDGFTTSYIVQSKFGDNNLVF